MNRASAKPAGETRRPTSSCSEAARSRTGRHAGCRTAAIEQRGNELGMHFDAAHGAAMRGGTASPMPKAVAPTSTIAPRRMQQSPAGQDVGGGYGDERCARRGNRTSPFRSRGNMIPGSARGSAGRPELASLRRG